MNILFRNTEYLKVNVFCNEEKAEYFQKYAIDNIYYTYMDCYIGFENELSFAGHKGLQIGYSVQKETSFIDIKRFFYIHRNIHRLPVLDNRKLVGEYYDADTQGIGLYYRIEKRASSLIPFFREEFQKIIHSKHYVIDSVFSPHFRNILGKQSARVKSVSEIIIPILIRRFVQFAKVHNLQLFIMNGIKKTDLIYTHYAESIHLNDDLETSINDDDVLKRVYRDDPFSLEFVQRHKNDLNHISRFVSDGVCNKLLDHNERGFNILNGQRATVGWPQKIMKKVHIYGPCVVQGLCVVDSKTIPSYLQSMINIKYNCIAVCNHGLSYGKDLLNDLLAMMETDFSEGDIVVWLSGYSESELSIFKDCQLPIIDGVRCLQHCHDWFINIPFHCNAKANKIMATQIFSCIETHLHEPIGHDTISYIKEVHTGLETLKHSFIDTYELEDYLKYLGKNRFPCSKELLVGAIIMNANPCTIGHLYLIEQALKTVNLLYVFVVQENTEGGLDFHDRYNILSQHFKDDSRVRVLTSGSILASEISFPEYFNGYSKNGHIDPMLDIEIFCRYVAPLLNIKYRFFGEEPYNEVTRSFNMICYEELPKYKIKVKVVNRLRKGSQFVSASTVRRLFDNKQYDKIKELVPPESYYALMNVVKNNNLKYEDNSIG